MGAYNRIMGAFAKWLRTDHEESRVDRLAIPT
jgi:hypothetical protein